MRTQGRKELFCNGYGVRFAAPFTSLCCVLPSLLRGSVCALGVSGWQEPDVDCFSLLISCFACCLPPPTCVSKLTSSDQSISRQRSQKGDSQVQIVVDSSTS
jgi:hypothetical protein